MKFRVSGISDIMCTKCKGTTRVAPKKFYNTDDLTCNCSEKSSVGSFEVSSISDIICTACDGTTRVIPEKKYSIKKLECICGKDADEVEDKNPTQNETVSAAASAENPKQTKMFEEEPENVIDPDDSDMTEDEVRVYLKSLGWQELLEAAKNNEVTKPPSAKREELEELIIRKVFHE